MQYFVTGATGFIGKRLVKALLARRGATVYFLLRPGSEAKVPDLLAYWGAAKGRAIPVMGDLTGKKLGVAADQVKALKGSIDQMYHLAAVYDLAADEASQVAVNVEGTRNAVEFAKAIDAGRFNHVSSIAAAGLYEGVFREDMFDEAENLDHPYFATKHESEKIVRTECKVPWSVYRPAMVVGDSQSGEMDKIDGPYYFFKLIQRMRQVLPPWMPAIGLEGGRINIVPVDFVVAALDHISHQKHEGSGQCYHLVDPEGLRVGDVLAIFSKAAHAPKMNVFVNAALLGFIPRGLKKSLMALAPVRRVRNAVMKDLGLPEDILTFVNYPTRFDDRDTPEGAQGLGHRLPAAQGLRLAPVGLLGAPPRPGAVHRPQPQGHRGGQGGAGHRRLVGHRPGRGLQVRRGRRDHRDLRPRRGQARRGEEGDPGLREERRPRRRAGAHLRGRHRRARAHAGLHRLDQRDAGRRGLPDQQRRALHPPRDRGELRPLPRLRAHDAAELLRLHPRDDGPAARHGGQEEGPHRQHQLDRRAHQRAALLGLRRPARPRSMRGRAARPASTPTWASPSPRSTCRWCARP